ncbi:unnamed protein product [Lactuca saligna]|uniref:Uncharacterized protein n=1 Tax=Lactuca saligna TaxID=75948 RepID=A0AA35ZK83_LACSI|nr:unnamed protein product [Lactuca saligna]
MDFPLLVSLDLLSVASISYTALAAIGTRCNPAIGSVTLHAVSITSLTSIGSMVPATINVQFVVSIGYVVVATIDVKSVVSIGCLSVVTKETSAEDSRLSRREYLEHQQLCKIELVIRLWSSVM